MVMTDLDSWNVGNSAEDEMAEAKRYLTTGDVADLFGVSKPTVRRLIDSGELAATKIGTHRRVLPEVAHAYHNKMLREAGGEPAGE